MEYTDQLTFGDYVESAARQLPNNSPLSLVAESFSGPIAIALLAKKEANFQASVLSATFCKSPLPLLTQMSKYVPGKLSTSNPASKAFLEFFLTGRDVSPDVKNKVYELLNKVSPSQFQNRIALVNEVDVIEDLKEIEVPLLYIQATKDRIVFSDSGTEIMKHAKNIKIERVEGPHMILQAQPKKCAELIVNHVTSNNRMQSDAAKPRR